MKSLADSAFRKKEYAVAAQLYTEAIECQQQEQEQEETCKLYSNRSATYCALHEYELALRDADLIIAMMPNWDRGYFRKAKAFEGLGLYEDAKQALQAALAREPNEQNKRALEDVAYNVMIAWLCNGGARFPKLYLEYYGEEYRGVHVVQNIPPEEVIMEIPLKFIVTTELAKASDIGRKIEESRLTLSSQHSYLACYLLQEKKKEVSFWDPYLRCLPKKYSNMPINFTEEEKEYLKGSFALDKMAARVESLQTEYNNICSSVPEFAEIASYEEFVWARHVVITRIFGMVIFEEKTNGLVPMADMLNHKIPKETKWTYDKERKSFTITSMKQLHQGDQVYDSYGRKCNHRFFVNYGFALEDNEDNETVLRFKVSENDPLFDLKAKYLGDEERIFQIPANSEHERTAEMFSFLRLFVADNEDVRVFTQSKELKFDKVAPLSVGNEKKVLEAAKEASLKCLERFASTLEEDERLLKEEKDKLTFNIKNCILMRRGEKQVCHYFIDLANSICPLFEKTVPEIKDSMKKLKKKLKKTNYDFDKYVTSVLIPLVEKASK
jgi:histone-lysine N-methyltransferase SETD3